MSLINATSNFSTDRDAANHEIESLRNSISETERQEAPLPLVDNLNSKTVIIPTIDAAQNNIVPSLHLQKTANRLPTNSSGNIGMQMTTSSSSRNRYLDTNGSLSPRRTIQKSNKRLKRGPYMCKICRGYGHTSKTCTKRKYNVLRKEIQPAECKEAFLHSLQYLDHLRKLTPKEQLYLHHESIAFAIYQLAMCAYNRAPYSRDIGLQALRHCLEAEKTISECISCYNRTLSRIEPIIQSKTDAGEEYEQRQLNPECQEAVNEIKRCLHLTVTVMRNADRSLRNILSNNFCQALLDVQKHSQVNEVENIASKSLEILDSAVLTESQKMTTIPTNGEETGNLAYRPYVYVLPSTDKSDLLALGQHNDTSFRANHTEGVPGFAMELKDTNQEGGVEDHFKALELLLPSSKE